MLKLNRSTVSNQPVYPERILQFGEGNFLRAFADWMVTIMNKKADFNSSVVVVQPIERGMVDMINAQDGLYHVYLKGIKNGQPIKEFTLVDCITRGLNPNTQLNEYKTVINNPELRFIISNTTEAGIAWDENDHLEMELQNSFPGKMTALLYQRFKTFNGDSTKGLIIICCELIDRNAYFLKKYVLRHSENWNLESEFIQWLNNACAFCNSLVDRIVPGFPKDEIATIQQELGYEDNLVVVGEYFHLWVIEGPDWVQKEFPAEKAGLDVKFVKDMKRFREQKVQVLNGCHTGSYAVSFLSGMETVREAFENLEVGNFMKEMVYDEVLPVLDGSEKELKSFANKILERFRNPYIRHLWQSIALNAMSKWETRNLPTLLSYYESNKMLPQKIVFSLAAMGTTVLTEVPEMLGAEMILMERAENKDVFEKTVRLINDFKDYFSAHNQPVYENPSPGNKAGGITTLEEKSLGCTQKCGNATIVDVLKYGERIRKNGLNLLSGPGNDLVATSSLGFSGCQMVLFTTGRGTPFGSFVPTMKISTNTALYLKKRNWIDFNAGELLNKITMSALLENFINYIIEVAEGAQLNHEKTGFKEIAIFKMGVTL